MDHKVLIEVEQKEFEHGTLRRFAESKAQALQGHGTLMHQDEVIFHKNNRNHGKSDCSKVLEDFTIRDQAKNHTVSMDVMKTEVSNL